MQIDVNLTRTAADLIAEFGAGAKLYLYVATTATGSYSLVTSTVLVSGTERYELDDTTTTPGTSVWYKPLVGNSGASRFAGDLTVTDTASPLYIAPFQFGSLTAYATLDDLVATLALGGDQSRYGMLSDLLADVSGDLDAECGRQFYRSPQVTGTETFHVTVTEPWMASLALASRNTGCTDGKALDIVSLDSLSVRDSETAGYVALTAGVDYHLVPGDGPDTAGTGWPWGDVMLIGSGRYAVWPTGYAAVEATGVRGFPRVPGTVKRAVISEARSRFRSMVPGNEQDTGAGGVDDADWRRATAPPFAKRSWVG